MPTEVSYFPEIKRQNYIDIFININVFRIMEKNFVFKLFSRIKNIGKAYKVKLLRIGQNRNRER